MAKAPKPTTINIDEMPEETIRYLAAATLDFMKELMRDPVSRAKLEARVAQDRAERGDPTPLLTNWPG